VLPAIDVGKSVSRVGGKAQHAAFQTVVGQLKLAYAQFEELESFARFGARLDEDTLKTIEHGRRIRACLKQPEFTPVPVTAQITVLLALTAGLFDPIALEQVTEAEQALRAAAAALPADLTARLLNGKTLGDADRAAILELAQRILARFQHPPVATAVVA
jgi:F-type H+-transporting ATPase subunit alpha